VAMDGFEDWEFWLKIGRAGFRGKLIPETLFNYRRHGRTLNINSERRSGKLLDRIRATHADLYSHPEQIREIQKGYRDIRVPNPFLNLSSVNQYRNLRETRVVVIASANDAQVTDSFLENIILGLNSQDKFHFILVTTDPITYEQKRIFGNSSNRIYDLARFLDSYCWPDFVLNLINTRTARFVVVSNSKPASEWTPAIKARTSALIVDVKDLPSFLTMGSPGRDVSTVRNS
jgi:hypothetical protein